MITAPFNFVPLNDKVFFPDWAEKINHDIPFEDGESGVIDITITAKSPIFIRDHKDTTKFCNYNGEYFIPSTSVKGMVRNVLEIMSFGKMSFIDDKTYSFRDLKNNNYLELFKGDKVRCGWLFYDEDGLKIEDCGNPYRISYDSIDNYFDIDFKEKFMEGNFDNAKSPYKKAFEKYKLIPQDLFNNIYSFSNVYQDSADRKIVEFDKNGEIKGKIVMTGHPSPRKEPTDGTSASGKIYDFVFAKLDNSIIYKVKDKVFENFKFAYFDGRKTQPKESEDWTFWKEKLYKGKKIPVFFHIGKDEYDKMSVTSFGLSYLY